MGPIAGLAAGLGIAALMSHLGFGEGFANFLTMILLAVAAVFVVRWLLRRFAPATARPSGLGYAAAGAGTPAAARSAEDARMMPAGGAAPFTPRAVASTTPASAPALPPGFDRAEFERAAKMIFVRMQAANDAGDLDDLRQFSTPEMFAAFRVDLQDRQGTPQRTDVVQLDAELLDIGSEGDRQIVSVRFHGLIREEAEAAAAPFDEVWHLVRPTDGSRPWAIAGIQQSATTH
jgi:predicted lipid-binding transport protein (Tim44 family)